MTRPLLLALLLLGSLLAGPAVAQDGTIVRVPTPETAEDCPVGMVCVEIEDDFVIALDPECGPVQSTIVREELTRTTDLSGSTESYVVHGLVFLQEGDTYRVVGGFSEPATGPLADVRFRSHGCMSWDHADA